MPIDAEQDLRNAHRSHGVYGGEGEPPVWRCHPDWDPVLLGGTRRSPTSALMMFPKNCRARAEQRCGVASCLPARNIAAARPQDQPELKLPAGAGVEKGDKVKEGQVLLDQSFRAQTTGTGGRTTTAPIRKNCKTGLVLRKFSRPQDQAGDHYAHAEPGRARSRRSMRHRQSSKRTSSGHPARCQERLDERAAASSGPAPNRCWMRP